MTVRMFGRQLDRLTVVNVSLSVPLVTNRRRRVTVPIGNGRKLSNRALLKALRCSGWAPNGKLRKVLNMFRSNMQEAAISVLGKRFRCRSNLLTSRPLYLWSNDLFRLTKTLFPNLVSVRPNLVVCLRSTSSLGCVLTSVTRPGNGRSRSRARRRSVLWLLSTIE